MLDDKLIRLSQRLAIFEENLEHDALADEPSKLRHNFQVFNRDFNSISSVLIRRIALVVFDLCIGFQSEGYHS